MSGSVTTYKCEEQTTRFQEVGKVVFKWTIEDFNKFQNIEAEFRSPSFAIKCGLWSVEKFHLQIQCLKPEKPEKIFFGYGSKSSLDDWDSRLQYSFSVGLFKESEGEVWSKMHLDRNLRGSLDTEDKVENLVREENHILKPGCNKGLFKSSFKRESDSKVELILTMALMRKSFQSLQNQICPIQNVSGVTKWKEVGKINFKWTIEDYKAHKVFQRSVRSECLTVECEDGNAEVFHLEATLPSKDDIMKLTVVKKTEGEVWADIGVTGKTYVRTGTVYKDLGILREGKNEDMFKHLERRVEDYGNDLTFHVEIAFCKSSFELTFSTDV